MTGIIQKNTHKLLAINTMPDHLHVLFGFRPTQSLSDLIMLVKGESSEWVNKQQFCPTPFRWQDGYGAFSYSKSQLHRVVQYIMNQEQHHHEKTFLEEYEEMLNKFEVEYDKRYIFKLPE